MAIERLQKISREDQLRNLAESRERSARIWELEYQGAIDEGMEKGIETVAVRMLKDGYEISEISKITGLSEGKIKQLK